MPVVEEDIKKESDPVSILKRLDYIAMEIQLSFNFVTIRYEK